MTGIRDACSCGSEFCFVRPAANDRARTSGCGLVFPNDYANPTLTGDIAPAYEAQIQSCYGVKVPVLGFSNGQVSITGLKTLRNRSKDRHEWRHGRGTIKNPCFCGRSLCWGNPKSNPCIDARAFDFVLVYVPKVGVVLAGIDYRGDPSAFDGRTQTEKDLAAVQKAIRDIANGNAVKSYSVAGRNLTRYEMADLIALESKLKFEVQRERRAALIANGKGDPFNLFVRF